MEAFSDQFPASAEPVEAFTPASPTRFFAFSAVSPPPPPAPVTPKTRRKNHHSKSDRTRRASEAGQAALETAQQRAPEMAQQTAARDQQLVQLRFLNQRLLSALESTLTKPVWQVPPSTDQQFNALFAADARITFAAISDSWNQLQFGPRWGMAVARRLLRARSLQARELAKWLSKRPQAKIRPSKHCVLGSGRVLVQTKLMPGYAALRKRCCDLARHLSRALVRFLRITGGTRRYEAVRGDDTGGGGGGTGGDSGRAAAGSGRSCRFVR